MSGLVVVGVDPGGRATGVVVRRGDDLLAAATVSRDGEGFAGYLAEVVSTVAEFAAVCSATVLAVEDAQAPNPRLGLTNPTGIVDAAKVFGAVAALTSPPVLVVAPGGHGALAQSRAELVARYPGVLIGAREVRGAGALRHLRSAWDVAGMAAVVASFADVSNREDSR